MQISTKPSLTEELKTATNAIHLRLDKSSFFAALANKNLPIESYVNYLQAMAGINGTFEKEIQNADHPLLNIVWESSMEKLPAILVDLESLNSTQIEDIPLAIDGMLDTIKFIRICRVENPLRLLGIMYVLEGSTLGGRILKKMMLANFNFPDDNGVMFLDHYKEKKQTHWEEFKAKINALELSPNDQEAIIETACYFFKKIESIFIYLFPIYNTVPFYNVTTLNPEAGKHNIPDDKLEIEAALQAGVTTWEQFPYYAWRYGLRGKQYTKSDSVWLVTLCELDDEIVVEQIRWLGRVLASRGMPQWLLAIHLVNLVKELEKVHPKKINEYRKLIKASEALRMTFNQVLSEKKQEELILEFENRVGLEWSHRLKNMGAILVSAVCDEHIGIEKSLSSVESWATDEKRFPQIWIDSVRHLIQTAKTMVSH